MAASAVGDFSFIDGILDKVKYLKTLKQQT